MTVLKELKSLSPSSFFEVKGAISKLDKKKKGALPDTTGLLGEGRLISLSLFWTPHALTFTLKSHLSIEEGDRCDLFIDTRDLKNSNVITRFCHHFIIYPDEEEGIEVTRFRGEDTHPIAEPSLIHVETEVKRSTYMTEISLPKEILYGYDPDEFKRLGFSYIFKRKNGEKQHFNLSSDFFNLEKHPALWASLELV